MKRFEKGASLGFCITTALLVAIITCALFVSCGRKGDGTGTIVGAHRDAPAPGGSRTAPTVTFADLLKQVDAYPAPAGVDAARFASLKAELKRLLIARASSTPATAGRDAGSTTSTVGVDLRVDPATKRADTQVRPYGEMRASPPAASGAGGPARQSSAAKSISLAPTGTMNAVTDLSATVDTAGSLATLRWTEALPGDYDNNGAVDIGDLIPLALYYGQRTDSGLDDGHRLVNGDANPEINIWDLGAIAANYAARIEGYQVWRGHWNGSSTDWETMFLPNRSDPTQTAFSVDRPSPPPPSRRPSYWYGDMIYNDSDKNNIRYKVIPYGDGAAGADSNEAAVPATTFSVSGRVTLLGNGLAGVTLTLAPGGLHATTQADGTFGISGVANGSYTLTPTGTGYVFTPASLPVTVNGANVSGLDFNATGGLANSAWPKFHGNAQNTGQSPYIGAQTNHVKWSHPASSFVYGSPAIARDGMVYIGTWDGKVYALNPTDGSVKWSYTTGGNVESSPAVGEDGTVYVGSDDSKIYALNPADGSVKWSYATGDWVYSSPAIGADGTVYVGSWDHNIYALSPADGSKKWSYTTGNMVYRSPAIGADGTVYVGCAWSDNSVYALNPSDGSVKWTCATGGPVWSSPAVSADGTVYVGSFDGNVYALSPADGSVNWRYATGDIVESSPAIGADGTVYIGSYDSKVYALNPADGSVKWSYATGSIVFSSPAISADGTVYVGSDDGKLYAFGGVGPSTYSVSVAVTLSGAGLAGVTMTLSPGGKTATTASDGTYKFTDILEGTYTLTPMATGYVFTPAQRSVTVKALDVTSQDFVATGGLANSAWPKFRGNAQNTGLSPYIGAQTNAVRWTFATGGKVGSSPTIGIDGTVYVGSFDHKLYAINPSSGSLKWAYVTDNPVVSSPAVAADGTVYVGGYDGIYALDHSDASPKWFLATGKPVTGSPAIGADGTVYVDSEANVVYALNPADGSVKWSYATGSYGYADISPAIGADGTVYIGSYQDAEVYALNPSDGSVKWRTTGAFVGGGSPAIGADGTIYVGGTCALNPSDGSVKWSHATGYYLYHLTSSPAIGADGTVYVGSDDNKVYALNPLDGSVKWTHATGGYVQSSAAIGTDGTVYVGSDDKKVYALRPGDGSVLWSFATGSVVESSPAIGADGTVYVGSDDGNVYAFGP